MDFFADAQVPDPIARFSQKREDMVTGKPLRGCPDTHPVLRFVLTLDHSHRDLSPR